MLLVYEALQVVVLCMPEFLARMPQDSTRFACTSACGLALLGYEAFSY